MKSMADGGPTGPCGCLWGWGVSFGVELVPHSRTDHIEPVNRRVINVSGGGDEAELH